jgi:hypothetical protein
MGDFIGAGQNYAYSQTNALITVTADGAFFGIDVEGDETWGGAFELANTYTQLEVGTYGNLTRYPFHDDAVGGLAWSGEGRGCNTLTGTVTINEVVYDGDNLVIIDLDFEQYCEGGAAALRGNVYWNANDGTAPPGPTTPPAGLWEPATGATPDSGNYVYLESEPGDFVGQGGNYLYTLVDAAITVSDAGGRLAVSVDGNEFWTGDFQAMSGLSFLEAGYYADLQRYPFHNPVKGGLSWAGEFRGCNQLTGWFVIDSVTYDGDTLSAIELRFEQRCDGDDAALHGEISWDANDTTMPPGPVVPPPAGLWEPTPGATPDSGTYVYLESEPGDNIGQGGTYLHTPADSVISVEARADARIRVGVDGDEAWDGDFVGMNFLTRLEVGYYGDLLQYSFHNPVKGGLRWWNRARGCGSATGWFVVDSVTYDGNNLMAIELRFEQFCDGGPPLHGEIHWSQ